MLRRRIGARSIESNVHLSRYKPEALPIELCGRGAGRRDQTSGLRFTRAALYQLSYASLVIFLAETRAVGRSYGSRGALMLRERRPARFDHSEQKIRSKSASTRAMISRVTLGFAMVVLP